MRAEAERESEREPEADPLAVGEARRPAATQQQHESRDDDVASAAHGAFSIRFPIAGALTDQRAAGAVMMGVNTVLAFSVAAWLLLGLLREDARPTVA